MCKDRAPPKLVKGVLTFPSSASLIQRTTRNAASLHTCVGHRGDPALLSKQYCLTAHGW